MKPVMLAACLLFTLPALADEERYDGQAAFTARAKVISVEPEYEMVRVREPETHCWNEPVYYSSNGEVMPMIVGGVIGGALGTQVGGGRGKKAATVAGAIAGTMIGHKMSSHHRQHPATERRCETVDRWVEEKQRVGYRVKYKFAGRKFVTHTDDHPGKWMDVRVNLEPL